jgi:predicted GNAT family acetyltransferase
VITHPAYRRQGLGKLVVAALARWAIEQGRIAQYRANTTNPVSLALAASLGFKLYFNSEALWFAQ